MKQYSWCHRRQQLVKEGYSKPFLILNCFLFNYFLLLCFMIFASVDRSLCFNLTVYLMPYLLLSHWMCLADLPHHRVRFPCPSVHEQKFTINYRSLWFEKQSTIHTCDKRCIKDLYVKISVLNKLFHLKCISPFSLLLSLRLHFSFWHRLHQLCSMLTTAAQSLYYNQLSILWGPFYDLCCKLKIFCVFNSRGFSSNCNLFSTTDPFISSLNTFRCPFTHLHLLLPPETVEFQMQRKRVSNGRCSSLNISGKSALVLLLLLSSRGPLL